MQGVWPPGAHPGLSGCEGSEGEAMPSARPAPDGWRNCGGAVGKEDSGGDVYEAK